MPTAQTNKQKQASSWLWFHRFGSPAYLYGFAERWRKPCTWIALALFLYGCWQGLVVAPSDYQMGDSYRIIYIHVPSAWMSMFIYVMMAICSLTALVWRMKIGHALARACAPIGAAFTALALITGSLWGKPTWGTYWIWDARLTSELVLLFLYFGYMALANAFTDRSKGSQAAAVLAIVGVVNIPIIHFSVEWWNTLHQGATVSQIGRPTMDTEMLIPLLLMFASVNFYFFAGLMNRVQNELLVSERQTRWVRELANG